MTVRAGLLAISCVVASACQQLEDVSDDTAADDGSEANAEWNDPPDQDVDEPQPPDLGEPVCYVEHSCACYGAEDHDFCVPGLRDGCGHAPSCIGLEGEAREDCLAWVLCDVDGHLEGEIVVCDPGPHPCAGACDLDPAACDQDGNGVLTFACGHQGLECEHGQFCIDGGDDWGCDADCNNCSGSEGDFECASLPPQCDVGTFEERRACVADLRCEFWVEGYFGYEINCGDNECHGG